MSEFEKWTSRELLLEILNRTGLIMLNLEDLKADMVVLQGDVARNTSLEGSAVLLIAGMAEKMSNLVAQLDDKASAEAQLAELKGGVVALSSSLHGSGDALAASIAQNTPQAPPVVPDPVPPADPAPPADPVPPVDPAPPADPAPDPAPEPDPAPPADPPADPAPVSDPPADPAPADGAVDPAPVDPAPSSTDTP